MINLDTELMKAEVLIEALPYIQKFNRKIIVVKYGGSAMVDEALKRKVIEDVVLLKLVGFKPIIVHGGGKEISKWVDKAGMETHFVNGLRVTDEPTMDPEVILTLLENDFIPVICPIGTDDEYNTYNINADDAACAIAKAVKAEKLAFLTDIEGVYRDKDDPETLISELSLDDARELIGDGCIGGGMLPKLNNCINAIEEGVSRVHILDGRIPHCLLLEIFTNKGIGTAIIDKGAERFYVTDK